MSRIDAIRAVLRDLRLLKATMEPLVSDTTEVPGQEASTDGWKDAAYGDNIVRAPIDQSAVPYQAEGAAMADVAKGPLLIDDLKARFPMPKVVLGPPPRPNRKEYPFVASLDFQGIPIDIEQRKGDTREGVDKDGKPWKVTMHAHYGEIRSHRRGAMGVLGAKGMDGDRLDVYVGEIPFSPLVVVVDQRIPETGEHDEQKVMLGFATVGDALDCYRAQYTKPGFYGGHIVMPIGEFKAKIADPKQAGSALTKALERILRKGAGVNTPEEEALWKRAKAEVEKQHGSAEGHWAEVQFIYQKMKSGHSA